MSTFVIGDVHGHLDRLEALLKKAGLLDRCERCDGAGLVCVHCDEPWECPCDPNNGSECKNCHGDGWARTNRDVTVVQLGDLGHFGKTGSPTGDMMTWHHGMHWLDVILWGNHDRAVFDSTSMFNGYLPPLVETKHMMSTARATGQLRAAHAVDGILLTHAGLHAVWKRQKVEVINKADPCGVANWLNAEDRKFLDSEEADPEAVAVLCAVGRRRGGQSPYGGILWRDASESLYGEFNQVFGHSAGKTIRHYKDAHSDSWCIDIGSPDNGRLAGMWLPSHEVVEIAIPGGK